MPRRPHIVLRVPSDDGHAEWRTFRDPVALLEARSVEEVVPVLEAVEQANRDGLWAAGFLAYEAAPAFDPALVVRLPGDLPLAWFGLFNAWHPLASPPEPTADFSVSEWHPSVEAEDYEEAVSSIHRWIAKGDTYQVNYTLRLRADFDGDPWSFFASLCGSSAAPRSAYIETGGRWTLCSASPELFFESDGARIVTRPMKGTAPRGRTLEEDRQQADWLLASPKNQAENVMIVDMVRNDLGRIARPGTVTVARLCELEKYPSLFQLTSTIEAETDVSVAEIFAALFPCASVTGAPKVRTMELISRLEETPRGIYTGAIGCVGPDRQVHFSVAIRTAQIDRETATAEYGTGGGIVWDSVAAEEYRECRTKSLVLTSPQPELLLLETLLWEPGDGYFLLDRHLERLESSGAYFDVPVDRKAIHDRLAEFAAGFPRSPHRVRLLVDPLGRIDAEAALIETTRPRWRVGLARHPVDRADRFLFHKTTHRQVYEAAHEDLPTYDDVILWNREGQITESTVANVVVKLGGELATPPLDCGLLPGVFRAELLAHGEVRERAITVADLVACQEIWLVNSVRRWIDVDLDLATLPERIDRTLERQSA